MSCKGCMKSGFCDPQMNGTTIDCPCGNCIVKVMCTENICERYNEFYFGIFNFNHEEFEPCILD